MTLAHAAAPPAPLSRQENPPLRLEPFEEYLLRDGRPGAPMVFPLVLNFVGQIDRSAFERAVAETLTLEPLLAARVKRRRSHRVWLPCETPPAVLWEDCAENSLSDRTRTVTPVIPIDLETETGFKVVATVAANEVKLACYFHHASTDGLGAIRFMLNALANYGQLIGDGAGLTMSLPQPELAPQRGNLCVELPEKLSAAAIARGIVAETYKWLARRPRPLASRLPEHRDALEPVMLCRRLNKECVSRLRSYARSRNCSLNDVLIRDMFLEINDWNRGLRATHPTDVARILMPTNLRKAAHARMPACNLIGYAFLTRTAASCDCPAQLLSGICEETKLIRTWSLGAMFIDGLKLVRRIPLALGLLTSNRFCHATSVLSNLGPCQSVASQRRFRREKTIRVGGLELRDVYAAPPVRPHTWSSLGIIGYQGNLCLAMTIDRNQVSEEQGNEFLNRYCARLKQTAAESDGADEARSSPDSQE